MSIQSICYISRFYILRAACFRVTCLRNYKFRKTAFRGKNRFCHQSAACESSGQTDYTNLRHFSVRVFLVMGHGREVLRMPNHGFDVFIYLAGHVFEKCPATSQNRNVQN